ncbi:hypothetical protein [Actinoplanes sp. NPDC051851]|uniref:hypothetical protein n=1 Tax=Actinoplanes sp. NPDC051851 TaxID=3154753 RepID=UPI00344066A4
MRMLLVAAGTPLPLPREPRERMLFGGHGFGRLAAAGRPDLIRLAEGWRPDAVVGGTLSYAAALPAVWRKLPWLRHAWDMVERPKWNAAPRPRRSGAWRIGSTER